jgi:hypothetical protein
LKEIGTVPPGYNPSRTPNGISIQNGKIFSVTKEVKEGDNRIVKKQPGEERYTDDDDDCESLEAFTNRRRGGAGLVNLDDRLIPDEYKLLHFTRREARKEIFNIGGSQALKVPEPNANTFKASLGRRDMFRTPAKARD